MNDSSDTNNLYISSKNLPVDIYLFKFNNRNTRKRCEICSNNRSTRKKKMWNILKVNNKNSWKTSFILYTLYFILIVWTSDFSWLNKSGVFQFFLDYFHFLGSFWLQFVESFPIKKLFPELCLFSPFPVDIYLLKVNNKNTRTRCEICSKLTIKTLERRQWRRSGVFMVNFEHISLLVLVFLLLTLNM